MPFPQEKHSESGVRRQAAGDAEKLHSLMVESGNRHLSRAQVRNTEVEAEHLLRGMSKSQIKAMAVTYRERYGTNMRGDLINTPAWRSDLDVLTTYSRGSDNLRSQDVIELCSEGAERHDRDMFMQAFTKADLTTRLSMRHSLLDRDGTLEVGNSIYTITESGALYRLADDARAFRELFPSAITQIKQGDYGTCYIDSTLLAVSRSQFGKFFLARLIKPDGPDHWRVNLPLHGDFKISRSDVDSYFWQMGGVDADLGIRILESCYGKYRLQNGCKPRHTFFGDIGYDLSRMKLGGANDALLAAGTGGDPARALSDITGVGDVSYAYGDKSSFFHALDSWAKNMPNLAIEATSKEESQYRGNTYLDWTSFEHTPDRSHQIIFNHAYSVLSIDPVRKTVLFANPWDSSRPFTESYANTYKYFYDLAAVKLDPRCVEASVAQR